MVRRALIGLTALVGVASAQPVPNATWTLPSPRTAPTVEWSSNGQYVALSTSSSVQVLDGSYKLKWARTITSAQPSFLSYYNRPDRIHFSATGDSVYVKNGANSYSEYSVATGDLIRTISFPDWTGDYLLSSVTTPTTGKMLIAIQVSVTGGVETLNLRSYDEATLTLVSTKTLTHTYVPNVDIPIGRYRTRVGVGFYDKLINPSDGTVVDYNGVAGAGSEAWTIGFDYDLGAVQQVVSSASGATTIALRRIDAKGVQTWSDASQSVSGQISFVKYGSVTNGLVGTGSKLHAFDYMTGAWADYSGPSTVSFGYGAASKVDGRLLLSYTDTTGNHTDAFSTNGGLSRVAQAVYQSGIGAIEPASNGLLVSGLNSYYGLFDQKNGNARWTGNSNPISLGLTTSTTGILAAAVYADRIEVLNSIDGTSAGSYMGVYNRAFWLNDSRLVAVKADGSADLLNVASGSVTFGAALPVAFVAGGGTSNNGKFAIGYANGKIHLFNVVNMADKLTDYPQFVAGWEKFFRITSLADGRVALLEKTGTGLKWQTYTVVGGKLVLDAAVPYTPSISVTGATNFAGDLQGLSGGPVSAFFATNGVDAGGTPMSQLKIVRVSDQKVLATYDNAFSNVSAVRFSLDGSSLFVATGGGSDLGPEGIYALQVPAWLDRITGAATVPSGGKTNLTAYVANKAPASGVNVEFSASPTSATFATSAKLIPAYKASIANEASFPAVGTDTTYTFSATIPGSGESVSTTVVLKAPIPTTVTYANPTIVAGQTATGTVTMAGIAPTGGYVVNLASDDATATVPATVTIPEGTNSTTFTVTTQSSGRTIRPNITATANGVSATGQLRVNANTLNLAITPTTITAGGVATGTVSVNVPTTGTGIVVSLTSSSAGAKVPATVTIPAGATSADFTVSTPSASTGSTPVITATYDAQVKTVNLTVNQTPVSSLTLNPTTVAAGAPTTATITLGTAATTGGVTVPLTYTGTGVAGPSSVTVPAGATSADVTVTTTASLTGQTASVTATYGSSSKSANLTITSTAVTAFTVTNASIVGGLNSTGTITISSPAPSGGLTLTIGNNKPALVAAPATVTIAQGATTASFAWVTTPTLSSQAATYTATSGTSSKTATQTVVPPKVTGLTVSTNTVTGGTSITYTITLDGAAPAGFGVTVSSNNVALKVTSPAKFTTGVTTQTFTATTTTVTSTQTVTLTASANGGTQTQTVTINP